MKVLQIVQTLNPETGGVARAVTSLSEGLQRRGVQVEIIVLDNPDSPWLSAQPVAVHAVGAGATKYRYSKALRAWLAKHGDDFDRVVTHGLWQYHSFVTWQHFHRSPTPYFVYPHGMLDPWFKRTFPLKHLKKWLYWPWADYRVLRDAAAVIFTSEEERLLARRSFWLYRAREVVCPLGLDASLLAPTEAALFAARFPEIERTRVLLFLGRIHPKKGCDILIDALPRRAGIDTISLVIAGPDKTSWAADLRRRVIRMDISPRVVFTGMLEGALKRGAFGNADAFILPSHQENFGLSVVEALSHGVPVLISDRVNIWREIEADRAGYVESDDVAGTIRLIERWLRTPAEERDVMRANARRCFVRRFELNHAIDSLLPILRAA